MRTWAAIANALSWNMVSEQWTDIIKRISRNKIDQTRTISKSIKQSINHQFTYVGPPPKPVYFAQINSINLITWELRNLIYAYFKTFKNQRKFESGLPEWKWRPNFIEKMILVPKTLRIKILMTWKHFKNQKLENHFKTGLETIILKSKGKSLRDDTWHRKWPR